VRISLPLVLLPVLALCAAGASPADQDVTPAGWARVGYVRDLPDGRRFANDSRGFLYLLDRDNRPSVYANVAAAFPFAVGRDEWLGDYTLPAVNKFAADGDPKTLGEIYAYGFRNAHRLSWDRWRYTTTTTGSR